MFKYLSSGLFKLNYFHDHLYFPENTCFRCCVKIILSLNHRMDDKLYLRRATWQLRLLLFRMDAASYFCTRFQKSHSSLCWLQRCCHEKALHGNRGHLRSSSGWVWFAFQDATVVQAAGDARRGRGTDAPSVTTAPAPPPNHLCTFSYQSPAHLRINGTLSYTKDVVPI